ncbi:hypothetical protein MTO96_048202 [Rhipicephalus appendiculatus]
MLLALPCCTQLLCHVFFPIVCEQLEEVILKLFKDALGRAAHGKAVQCLRAYRESALEVNPIPNMFNTFLKKLKELYSGDQDDVWNLLAKEAVPPIAKKECDRSTWPDGEVENFYAAEKQNADKEEQPAKDEDDLLDMM